MRYEIIDGLSIPKIGFGTWKIGGGSSPDRSQDARALAALRSALGLGYTHFDTAEMYGGGHTEELLGRAIHESGLPRKSLFITSKVVPEHLRYDNVLKACDASLKRLGMDYLDLYLIHWPSMVLKLPESFRALNQLVKQGKVRRVGVSNFDLRLLKAAEELSETPLLTESGPVQPGRPHLRWQRRPGLLPGPRDSRHGVRAGREGPPSSRAERCGPLPRRAA